MFRIGDIEQYPDFISDFEKYHIQRKEHPWEIINKYLAFTELEKENRLNNSHEVSSMLLEETKSAMTKKAFTTDAIIQFGEIQYAMKCGKNCDEAIVDLYRQVFGHQSDQAVDPFFAIKDFEAKRFVFMNV